MATSTVLPVTASLAALSSTIANESVQQKKSCTLQSYSAYGTTSLSSRALTELRAQSKRNVQCSRFVVRALEEIGSAAGAGGDSIVSEVALLEEEAETPGVSSPSSVKKERKPGALQRGGTLSGAEALGKDPSLSTLSGDGARQIGAFEDPRWTKGNWDLAKFTKNGKVNWDGVIDAEVKRRKWLEDNPEASNDNEPVLFETSTVPWWAWVKRFHLPEAELLNGRAAMLGYLAAYLVDSATGVGLVDQQNSFLGKLLLFITIAGVVFIRKNEDLNTLKGLVKESTFYDKQWQATWKEDTTKEENP